MQYTLIFFHDNHSLHIINTTIVFRLAKDYPHIGVYYGCCWKQPHSKRSFSRSTRNRNILPHRKSCICVSVYVLFHSLIDSHSSFSTQLCCINRICHLCNSVHTRANTDPIWALYTLQQFSLCAECSSDSCSTGCRNESSSWIMPI